jgi:hypothetical protein
LPTPYLKANLEKNEGEIMKDKSLKILLGIIAINLTIQTVRDVGLFPTAYAQSTLTDRGYPVQKVQIVSVDEAPSLYWEALHVDVR